MLLSEDSHTKEVKKVVFQLNPEKAPGPDGFNAFYFQILGCCGDDTSNAILSFFQSGKLLKEVNHTFITLIPKITNSSHLADFRPISCCNTPYKIISKVLCNGLEVVIKCIISSNQCPFLKGRQISDCSLLAHELVRDFKKKNAPKGCCLKINLHKAFDSVNRDFVYCIMECMGFPQLWVNWIRECLSTPTFPVMLNVEASGKVTRFHLAYLSFVMEFWSIHMDIALASGKISSIRRDSYNYLTHLLFADNLLIFVKANKSSNRAICALLEDMKDNTGLSIIKQKSKI